MPVRKEARRPSLWKEWDKKADKAGYLYPVYFVSGTYSGHWAGNLKDGKGLYRWKETGTVYEGDWKKGHRSGHGTLCHQEAKGRCKKEYIGGWKDGLKHGYGTQYYSDKEYYEGEWQSGKRSGWGRMLYADGTMYEGEWSDDLRSGQGMLRQTNDNRYEGCWENDMKNGSGKYFYLDSGQIFEGFWKNGIPKCGTMRDYGRADAEKPTPLPIPEIKVANPDEVLEQAQLQFLLSHY